MTKSASEESRTFSVPITKETMETIDAFAAPSEFRVQQGPQATEKQEWWAKGYDEKVL